MRKVYSCVFPAILALVLICTAANAQVLTGTITGSVVDPTDARIPNAKVTATDTATSREYVTQSDNAGSFTITNLPNGFFKVTVEASGFSKMVIERVQVFVSQTSSVIAKLEVSRVGTEVVVHAEQSVVQTESIELKNSIQRAQIMNLPLPSRNPLDLVRTMAGILSPTTGSDSFVHGMRGNATNLTQDGINVADNFVKTSAFFAISAPTVDTVGEFNVSVGGIGADAGFGAAQVSIVTQRGANEFHGSAFWYQRTSYLNANTWFNNAAGSNPDGSPRQPTPFQLQNRLGGSGGGPVYIPKLYDGRNKTFVFGSYEAYREPRSQPRVRTVMTPSARQGLFTYAPTTGGGPRQVNLLSLGTLGTATGPATISQDAMNFYNSLVPADGLTDTGCSGDGVNIRCYPWNIAGKNAVDRYTLRVDHQLTQKHSLSFVWNQADFFTFQDFLNGIESQFPKSLGGGQSSRRQVFVWAVTSTFGSNKTNDARVGYQRAPVGFDLFEQYQGTGGYQLRFAGVTDPTFTQTNLPQGRNTPVRQAIDNFTWIRGRHTIRIGGEYRLLLASSYFYNTVTPLVTIGTNPANPNGLSGANLPSISSGDLTNANNVFNNITGLLSAIQRGYNHTSPTSGFVPGVPRVVDPIMHNVSWYVQDSWRVKPGLTAQYGVRWEFQGVFDLRNQLVLLSTNGLAPSGDPLLNLAGGRNGKPVYDRDLNNFAPFAGFAWDPWKNGKTSIRGAFATHFLQDGFTVYQVASTANTGLFATPTNNTVTGAFRTASNPVPPAPAAAFPVSQKANFIANTGAALWDFPKNFVTPYVLEWNFGVQRELWKRFSVEARYVGNHNVKGIRSYSINEIDFQRNGLLREFLGAQTNLNINAANGRAGNFANNAFAGQVATPVLDKLFAGLAAASAYTNSGFVTNLQQNTAGSFWNTLRTSNTYRPNRESGFPLDFFVPSPYANAANTVSNNGWSIFHGLEFELNRRFSSGFFMAANYTFSRVLTDTGGFTTSQQENQNYRAINNPLLDKARALFDVTHSFSANFLFPLPLGRGKQFFGNSHGVANLLISGWQINALSHWQTGSPFTIRGGRSTTGSLFNETAVIRNMTASQLQQNLGVFRDPTGVYWLDPKSGLFTITPTSSRAVICTASTTTPCFDFAGPGQFGNLPVNGLNTPRYFNQDFALAKHTRIREKLDFETRIEMFNAFNHPTFGGLQTQIDSTSFGKLTSTLDTARGGGVTSRIVQWAAKINF